MVEANSELEAPDEVIERKSGRHGEASKRSSELEASEEATERQPGCHRRSARKFGMGSGNWRLVMAGPKRRSCQEREC